MPTTPSVPSAGIKPYELLIVAFLLAAMHAWALVRARRKLPDLPDDERAIVKVAVTRHFIFLPAIFVLTVAYWGFFKLSSWWAYHLPPLTWNGSAKMWLWAYLLLVPLLLLGHWWAGWDLILATAQLRGTPEKRRALALRWSNRRRSLKVAAVWVGVAAAQAVLCWYLLATKRLRW